MKRIPWDVLSSRELSTLLDVSIQVLANWRIRDTGPAPAPAECFRGNRTYYPVYEIEAWRRGVEPWEVVRDWLRERYIFPKPLETEERTWKVARQLQGWNIYPLQHRPRKPIPLPVK
jgi:hypothetical protein